MGQAGIACLCSTTWSSAAPQLIIRPLVLRADGYYPLARLSTRHVLHCPFQHVPRAVSLDPAIADSSLHP
jgi:hypothetical protein